MGRSVYQANEEKGCERREENLSGYIVPGLKTIEVSWLRRGKGENRGREDRQIFTRHKAVEQPPHRSSLLRRSPPCKVYRNGHREVRERKMLRQLVILRTTTSDLLTIFELSRLYANSQSINAACKGSCPIIHNAAF